MAVQTAKEYLKQTFTIDREIKALIQTVEELESKAEKITTSLQMNEAKTDFNPHSREDTIVKMIDMKNKINDRIDNLVDLKSEIFDKINKIEDPEYRTLLTLRYINLYTFEQIAVEMHYSWRHIIRKHGYALLEFEKANGITYRGGIF